MRISSAAGAFSSLILLLVASPLGAGESWRVTSWTTDDALPQGVVYAIHQTRDGYIWLTTLGGLVRYDGVEFTVFEKATTPGIRSNRFTTLRETADGSLWASERRTLGTAGLTADADDWIELS